MESFLKMPRRLWEMPLSPEAKLLYMGLADRAQLSARNGLADEEGVFVYCTLTEAARWLSCSPRKAQTVFAQLLEAKLLQKRRQGQMKPNRYYVLPLPRQPLPIREEKNAAESAKSAQRNSRTCPWEQQNLPGNEKKPSNPKLNQPEESKSAPLPVLSPEFLRVRAMGQLNYFKRLFAGEDKEALNRELSAYVAAHSPPPVDSPH